MSHDPEEIANYLVAQHGLDKALEVASLGIRDAHEDNNLYDLSIWREVRTRLRKRKANSPV